MKDKKINLIVLIAFFIACSIFTMVFYKPYDAKAATTVKNVVNETFDGGVSDKWILRDGAQVKNDYSALRITPKVYDWGGHIIFSKYKLEGSCRVEFTLSEITTDGAWLAFSYGTPTKETAFSVGGGAFMFFHENSSLRFHHQGGVLVNATPSLSYPFSVLSGVAGELRTCSIEFEKIENQTYTVYVKVTTTATGLTVGEYFFDSVTISDGYFGFNSNMVDVDIREFCVYEGDELVCIDDFTSSSILFQAGGDPNANWLASASYDSECLYAGAIGQLDLRKIDSQAIYGEKIETAEIIDIEKPISCKASIFIYPMSRGVDTGFEIAKSSEGEKGLFFGVRRNLIGYSLVCYGQGLDSQVVTVEFDPLNHVVSVELEVFWNGKITFKSSDGAIIEAQKQSFSGFISIVTRDSDGTHQLGNGGFVDDFCLDTQIKINRLGEDKYNNFDGTKTFIDEGYEYHQFLDYSKKWFMGENVEISNYTDKNTNGVIYFKSSSVFSAFGPKEKYSDYIVRFDVCVFSAGNLNECFGLQFGKQNLNVVCDNTTYLGVGVLSDGANYISNNCLLENQLNSAPVLNEQGERYNFFDSNKTYNFLYVVKGGTVSVYFKESTESDEVLTVPRARCENVNTDGFLALFGTNNISLQVDNFSVINLDYDVKSSIPESKEKTEVVRVNFNANDKIYGLEVENAEVKDGKLEFNNGGKLTSKEEINSFIFRIAYNGNVVVKNGDLQIRVSSIKKTIEVVDESPIAVFDLDEGVNYLEIIKMGKLLTIAYVGENQPIAGLNTNFFTVDLSRDYSGYLTIEKLGAILKIDSLAVFNLKSGITILKRDHDPADDVPKAWYEKPPINEPKTGRFAEILIISAAITLVIVGVATVVILFRRRKKREEN